MRWGQDQLAVRAGALVLGAVLSAGAAAGHPDRLPPVLGDLTVVDAYRNGRPDEAVSTLRGRDRGQLAQTVARVHAGLKGRVYLCPDPARGEVALSTIDAAILLHTDAALAALAEARGEEMSAHLGHADRLIAWTRPARESLAQDVADNACQAPTPLVERDWLLAVTLLTLRGWALGSAVHYADRLHALAPLNSDALFASGAVAEAVAANTAGAVSDSRSSMGDQARRRQQAFQASRRLCETAATVYRQALDLSPHRQAIRLRLGRVLAQLGRTRESRTELERAVEDAHSQVEKYLAALFLGRVLQDQGEIGEAVSPVGWHRLTVKLKSGRGTVTARAGYMRGVVERRP